MAYYKGANKESLSNLSLHTSSLLFSYTLQSETDTLRKLPAARKQNGQTTYNRPSDWFT